MEGTPATLEVYVSGYPLVASSQIHWYRPNGTEVLEEEAMFENGRRTVVLSEVQPTHRGMYRCEVATSYGNHSTFIQLEVYGMMTSLCNYMTFKLLHVCKLKQPSPPDYYQP